MLEHNDSILCQGFSHIGPRQRLQDQTLIVRRIGENDIEPIPPLNETPKSPLGIRGYDFRPGRETEMNKAPLERSHQADIFFHECRKTRPPAQRLQTDIPAAGKEIEKRTSLDGMENIKKRFFDPIGGRPDAASGGKTDHSSPGLSPDDSHKYLRIKISAI
jgi:hypothetical protein